MYTTRTVERIAKEISDCMNMMDNIVFSLKYSHGRRMGEDDGPLPDTEEARILHYEIQKLSTDLTLLAQKLIVLNSEIYMMQIGLVRGLVEVVEENVSE